MALGSSLLIAVLILAGVVAALAQAAAVIERGGSRASATLFSVGWLVLAFIPVAWGIFGGRTAWYVQAVGAYDFAGAIPFHLGGGVGALAIALLIPRTDPGAGWHRRLSRLQVPVALAVLTVVWIVWLVLMETNFTELVVKIVFTSVILAGTSLVATMLVQVTRAGRVSAAGVAVGLVTGLVAATAACAFLEPLAAAATGLIAGTVSGAVAFGRQGKSIQSLAGAIAVTNLSGAVVGLLMIGLLESDRGFFYTGAMTLPVAQLTAVVVCVVYVALVATPLGLVAGGRIRRTRPEPARGRGTDQ
jgi:Amt family ammonium transporter